MIFPDDDYHPYYSEKPKKKKRLVPVGWPDGANMPRSKHKKSMRRTLVRLLVLQRSICFYCPSTISPQNANVDHVIPKSKGGTNVFTNLVACCITCNLAKGNRLPTTDELTRLKLLHKESHDVKNRNVPRGRNTDSDKS